MKADITFYQLWNNKHLSDFLMRDQSMATLEELVRRSILGCEETIKQLDSHTEESSFSDIEELLYDESAEECAIVLGIDIE